MPDQLAHIIFAREAALRELRIVLAVADRVSSDLDDLAADHAQRPDVRGRRRHH